MAHHNNYWSCTRFADWLRGMPKGDAKSTTDWRTWRKEAKSAHPVRFWLAEEGLDKIQDFVTWPIDFLYSIKYYINNRWVTKTHALTAHPRDIKPGTWHDVGYRFLPCLFNELQDFVETELAWSNIAWSNKEESKKYGAPFWAKGWFRWRTWRCPEAGLDYLEWSRSLVWTENEMGPDNPLVGQRTHQAIVADEIYALYKWWTETYRNRPDPYEASGWNESCSNIRRENDGDLFGKLSPELQVEHDRSFEELQKIEEAYEKEDEEMLIRLIKIRRGLWT